METFQCYCIAFLHQKKWVCMLIFSSSPTIITQVHTIGFESCLRSTPTSPFLYFLYPKNFSLIILIIRIYLYSLYTLYKISSDKRKIKHIRKKCYRQFYGTAIKLSLSLLRVASFSPSRSKLTRS